MNVVRVDNYYIVQVISSTKCTVGTTVHSVCVRCIVHIHTCMCSNLVATVPNNDIKVASFKRLAGSLLQGRPGLQVVCTSAQN